MLVWRVEILGRQNCDKMIKKSSFGVEILVSMLLKGK